MIQNSSKPAISLLWIGVGIFAFAWVFHGSPLLVESPWEFGECLVLMLICVWPMLAWYRRGMHEVPVVEVLCLNHFAWYILPYLNAHPALMLYPEVVRSTAGWALGVYVLAIHIGGTIARARRPEAHRKPAPILDRRLKFAQRGPSLPLIYASWVLFDILLTMGLIPYSQDFIALTRSLFSSIGLIALFFLSYRLGEAKRLGRPSNAWPLFLVFPFQVLVAAASGFLANTALIIFGAIAPYSLGRKKLAILPLLLAAFALNFLNLGKPEMRLHFWGEDAMDRGPVNPIEVYEFWIPASWQAMTDPHGQQVEDEKVSILTRSSLIHMLALVVSETPSLRDFLHGETYAMIPMLMVPRFLWPGKPRASLPTERLGIYYEIMTEEANDVTSVTFGQATEAWANFGWLGIVGVGICFGMLAGIGNRISWRRAPDSIGFLLASILLSRVWDVGNTAGTVLLGSIQGISFALAFLLLISEPDKSQRIVRTVATAGRKIAKRVGFDGWKK
ncbi:MAG: hypothetical protein WCO94_00525 [Verrucomicrobiota bacterium]